jgi:hypothetical protein
MKKCWAASLGGCSDKMSGEHIVSAGIFPGDKVSVQGLPWCLDAPKEIGLASFVKNILCTEHNNRLSPVDEAGIQTFKTINEFIRLGHVRSSVPVRRWTVKKFDVDGINFERWCLKTLINLTVDGPARIGPHSQPNVPYHELVGICFGLTEFRHPAGMYVSWAPAPERESGRVTAAALRGCKPSADCGKARHWIWDGAASPPQCLTADLGVVAQPSEWLTSE